MNVRHLFSQFGMSLTFSGQKKPPAQVAMHGPLFMAALAGLLTRTIEHVVGTGVVVALEQTTRAVDITIATPMPLSALQERQVARALNLRPWPRWIAPSTLQVTLPIMLHPDTPLSPCVPILRRQRRTLWWPLVSARHLVLAGDAHATLATMLAALHSVAQRFPMTFALHDIDGELKAHELPAIPAVPDALARACVRALRVAWAAHQARPVPALQPLILVVVAPDALAWQNLLPLLTATDAQFHVLILLGNHHETPAMRDVCHQLSVVEVGGLSGLALPESYRPPPLAAPTTGTVLAWQSSRRSWLGVPIDSAIPTVGT